MDGDIKFWCVPMHVPGSSWLPEERPDGTLLNCVLGRCMLEAAGSRALLGWFTLNELIPVWLSQNYSVVIYFRRLGERNTVFMISPKHCCALYRLSSGGQT